MLQFDEKLQERNEAKRLDAKNQALNTVSLLDDRFNFNDIDMAVITNRLYDDFYAYGEQIRKETVELFLNAVKGVEA